MAIPGLLDRPLYWLGIVPVGRTVGHSLLLAVPLVASAWIVSQRRERPVLGIALAVGSLSHIATDIPWHLLSGEYHELGFLLWPITHMPAYTGTTALGTIGPVMVRTLWLEAVIFVCG